MSNKNLDILQKTFPVPFHSDCKTEMEALYQFSQNIKIDYTPALLINGRLLSQLYSYKDLYDIARNLSEEMI